MIYFLHKFVERGPDPPTHPSWSNLLHLRFYSGNNLRVRRNVPMFYMDLWPACAHPKILLHLCYQKNSDCPTATRCALDLVEFEQGGKIFIHFFHNHVRNKVKSPHPHTTIKWVTVASHAPPPARSGVAPSATASAAARGSLPHVPVQ
jgi:hypothetical protein